MSACKKCGSSATVRLQADNGKSAYACDSHLMSLMASLADKDGTPTSVSTERLQ